MDTRWCADCHYRSIYIKETCCQDSEHIDNFQDEDYQDIFRETADMVKACLEAAFPGSTIFEPLAAFGGDENSDMAELLSSGGLIIINIFKYTVLISCFEV